MNAIAAVRPNLPPPYKGLRDNALRRGYYRALQSQPQKYDHWVSLVRQWGGKQCDEKPEAAYDFIEDLLEVAGINRAARIGELFEHLDKQWRWDGGRKLNTLRKYRDGMADALYWPRLRPVRSTRGDADAAVIVALMRADPKRHWTISELARKLHKSVPAVNGLVVPMRTRGDIVRIDKGRGLLALPRPGIVPKESASHVIIELLSTGHHMRFFELRAAVGSPIDRAVRTLRQRGVLTPADPSRRGARGAPIALTAASLASIKRGQPIRDGRGSIIWAPQ